ncbi:unnamed protein product [Rotaria sordida]|uniref:Peptidase S9 prolyl oligopeptidase catalytic domain-containing protein n=1 Tax=Rotaria sordida TaxID=392033 RepID=A0A819FCJ7_9BILA|nr:unnamed protein product [Rotaria sordida]CAF3865391.1 unnamed protein product [Rotaria sordida]
MKTFLVHRSQSVLGYESDQFKVKLFNGTTTQTLFDQWDRSIQVTSWSNDGQSLLLELGENGNHVIYQVLNVLTPNQTVTRLIAFNETWHDAYLHPNNSKILLATYDNFFQPTNIVLQTESSIIYITRHNDWLIRRTEFSFGAYHQFELLGARSETVSGWYLLPWNITSDKVSLAFLIHGGPQNSWYNTWGRRWNFQVYAAQGYAVIGINFHGSDSYGQNFTDSITGEYGTLPYEDLQLGLTAILKQKPYIDENRAVALGASYGGFMINWTVGPHRRIMILRT